MSVIHRVLERPVKQFPERLLRRPVKESTVLQGLAGQLPEGFENGIHLDFANDFHYIKVPGQDPVIAPFTSLFTFTGDNLSKYRGSNGLLQPSVTNTPRIEFDVNGRCLGLLLEGPRTNLCLQSEDFLTTWATTNASHSSNVTSAPDGTTTADKLIEDSTAAVQHRTNQTITVSTATAYTFSVFAKASERQCVTLRISTATDVAQASFNLLTGVASGIVGTAQVIPYANGWYRCIITGTTDSTTAVVRINIGQTATDNTVVAYNGDGTSGVFVWGAQLEQASFASSYIPTTTASVARAQEFVSRTDTENIVTDTAGTTFCEYYISIPVPITNFSYILSKDDTANYTLLSYLVSTKLQASVRDNTNVATKSSLPDLTPPSIIKQASSYGAAGLVVTYSGGVVVTNSYSGEIVNGTTLRIGRRLTNTDPMFGYIRCLHYWPEQKPNDQLQRLTE